MKTKHLSQFLTVAFALGVFSARAASPGPSFSNRPITFEANVGQADSAIEFVAHGPNGDLLLTSHAAWLAVPSSAGDKETRRALQLKLAGANPEAKIEGLERLTGTANYLTGNDPRAWHTGAPLFGKIKYHNVYPGIDLVYYGNQQQLEYDFVVQPGADPGVIVLDFADAEKITIDGKGNLLLHLAGATIRQHKPIVYQETAGQRKYLSGDYVLRSGLQVALQIDAYDKSLPLIIDPVLVYSTASGGTGFSQAQSIAADAQGNVYITGSTTANDFPTLNAYQNTKLGSQAAFVIKLDKTSALVYATYLGGGQTNDFTTTATVGQGIAVDGSGHAYVTGYTSATNFPTVNPFQSTNAGVGASRRNVFIAELNPAGNALIYSTYLGGSARDTALGLALCTNGEVVVTGYTTSANFPTANAVQSIYGGSGDAFVTRLSASGSALIYSTYLGGSRAEDQDLGTIGQPLMGAIALDLAGNAYVTGSTYSTNFPVVNAYQPTNATSFVGLYSAAFVTKIDPAGNLLYSTYFGGMLGDFGRAIGVDFRGDAFFAGNSKVGDLPTTNAFQPNAAGSGAAQMGDAFLAELDATGTNLVYCTYLGGHGDDQINGLAVRLNDGAVAVTGTTDSADFPTLNPIQASGSQGVFKAGPGATGVRVSNTGLTSSVVYSLRVDPSNPAVVYALTKNGCFKSVNGGASWTSASSGLINPAPSSTGGTQNLLVLEPSHPSTLYSAAFVGVFKTTNGAATWTSVSTGLPNFPGIQTLALDPSNPNTLYAGTGSLGVYKSIDGGASWTVATNGLTVLNIYALLVDPNNPSEVYAGVESFSSTVSVFKSTNGGTNWTRLAGGMANGAVAWLAAGPGNPATIYACAGNDLTSPNLKASTNGGTNWFSILTGSGMTFNTFALGPPALPDLTIASTGNSNALAWSTLFAGYTLQFTPSLRPTNWQNVPQSPVTNNGNNIVYRPQSAGEEYYRLINTNAAAHLHLPGKPGDPLATVTPHDTLTFPDTCYISTSDTSGQGILESTDGGATWIPIGPDACTISCVEPDPDTSDIVYIGVNGGHDGFACTFTSEGQPFTSSFIGGGGADLGNAVAVGAGTFACVAGVTTAFDFPVTTGVFGFPSLPPVLISDAPNFRGEYYVQAFDHLFPCPEDSSRPVEFEGSGQALDAYAGTVSIDSTPVLPLGMTLTVYTFSDLSEIQLNGTAPVGTHFSFTVTLSLVDSRGNKCTWNEIFSVSVTR